MVQIPTFRQLSCKSGLLGIYFVKCGGNERIAARFGRVQPRRTILQFVTGQWGSVHRGPNKTNKNKWLFAYCRVIEIDQEVNSIQVNRQVDQVRPLAQYGRVDNCIGRIGPDLRVCRSASRTSPAEKFAGITDGH